MHTLPLYGYFNITSLILLVMGIVIAGLAQARVRNAYAYYSRVPSARGYNASAVIRSILGQNGAGDVAVEAGQGTLTDNYNPRTKVIRLSPDVYGSSTIAALAIAAHEAGHAIQHRERYFFLSFRNFLAPVVTVVSHLAVPVIILGFIMSYPPLVDIGIYLFAAVLLFQLITLPVEYDASRRAMRALLDTGAITEEETGGVKKMLGSAALTYVAATLVTLLNLLRLVLLRRNNR